jgi:hypothetical protein
MSGGYEKYAYKKYIKEKIIIEDDDKSPKNFVSNKILMVSTTLIL